MSSSRAWMKRWTDFRLYVTCYMLKKKYWVKGELCRSDMRPGVNAVKDVEGCLDRKIS